MNIPTEPDGRRAGGTDLGAALQQFRKAAGLSQERLAVRCNMSQSRISRIERGKELPSVNDVERIVRALEMPGELAGNLVTLARRANIEHVSLRALAEVGLWRAQTEIKHLVELCSVQRSFLSGIVSDLLQVPEYARAALTPKVPSCPRRDVDKAVAARLDQQSVLDDPSRHFHFVMTEQAVRWKRAPRWVMAEQCAHLVEMAERPNIDIAIIPLTAEVFGAPLSSFHAFDERLVTVELFSGQVSYRDHKDIQYHLELFDFFFSHALIGDRARAFLLSARDGFM